MNQQEENLHPDVVSPLRGRIMACGLPYLVAVRKRDSMIGVTNLRALTIEIGAYASEVRDASLLHEMMHIALDIAGIRAPSDNSGEIQERHIDALSNVLYGMLKENGFWNVPDWWAQMRDA